MGRKAAKITIDELKEIIKKALGDRTDDVMDKNGYISNDYLRETCEKLDNDLSKIDFSYENFSCEPGGFYGGNIGWYGYHTLDNGFTFLGCTAGGDWEQPLFYIIYFDGKDLRGYIPEDGNVFDKLFKCAFGSEDEYDGKPINLTIKKIKQMFPFMDESYDKPLSEAVKEYNVNKFGIKEYMIEWGEQLGFSWGSIKEDIMTRIEVV